MPNRRAVVTIQTVERLNCSVNGNPRFRLTFDTGRAITESDGAVGYNIENHTRHLPIRKCLTFNERGTIVNIGEA